MNWRPAAKEPVLLLTFGLHSTQFRIVHLPLGCRTPQYASTLAHLAEETGWQLAIHERTGWQLQII
jgi:hypothetical protein